MAVHSSVCKKLACLGVNRRVHVAMLLYPPLTLNALKLFVTYLFHAPFFRNLIPRLDEGLQYNLENLVIVFCTQFCMNFDHSRLEELSECLSTFLL
jgi:hypothetical protein